MSGSSITMERAESFGAHRPGGTPSYGVNIAQRILSPMVVDGVVQDANGQGAARAPSAGSDMWGSQRLGTPAGQDWRFATTGSTAGLGGMMPRRVGSNGNLVGSAGSVGSLGFSATWQPGQPRPGSFRAQMAEIQQAGQAEMLTINEDGQFNADDFRRFDDGKLTPRSREGGRGGSHAAQEGGSGEHGVGGGGGAAGAWNTWNTFGGAFPTPRRTGSGRLSAVNEGGGIADTAGGGGLVGGAVYYNGSGGAGHAGGGGAGHSTGRVPTPMIGSLRDRTPGSLGAGIGHPQHSNSFRTPIGSDPTPPSPVGQDGVIDPRYLLGRGLSSQASQGQFIPSDSRRQELLASLARRSASTMTLAQQQSNPLPMWLRGEAQAIANATQGSDPPTGAQSADAANRPLPLWLRKEVEGDRAQTTGAETGEGSGGGRGGSGGAGASGPPSRPPVWLTTATATDGAAGGGGDGAEGNQLSSNVGGGGSWSEFEVNRVPTAGLGRRPGTQQRGELDTVLC